MPKIKFEIGKAFPASDPVARFVTVLAMMSNDWLRSSDDLLDLDDKDPDAGARRVWIFRQQASLHHEAAKFIRNSRRLFPDVETFISSLSLEAQQDCQTVQDGIDPTSASYHGDWLADHRNVTFHYPEMHPAKAAAGEEEIHEALVKAASIDSSIYSEDNFGSVRFYFADDVTVQWLPDGADRDQIIEDLGRAAAALARFVQRAAGAYLASRPKGVVVLEPDSESAE